jgi:translation initiation factor IF-2
VYELAKEVGLENRDVIRRLADLGVEAKSHSSSVSVVDAKRLKDSIGRSAEEREREDAERHRREQAELERYRTVEQQPASTKRKAAKVLPPHLREQQAMAEVAAADPIAPAAPSDASSPSVTDASATPSADPTADSAAGPKVAAPDAPDTGDAGADSAESKRMPGAPPRMRPPDAPIRPPVPGAPAPAVPGPTSPTEGLTVRRTRPDSTLPQEGSGRRVVPPPLREAAPRPSGAGAPGSAAPARGRPGPFGADRGEPDHRRLGAALA